MSFDIVVVGSLSLDMVIDVPRRPATGETIKGTSFNTFVGGKGNNQALAAAKLGAKVAMVGRVGNDQYACVLEDNQKKFGIDTSHLLRDEHEGTGLANIYVDPQGDNSIVIVPRSNDKLSPADVDNAHDVISQSAMMVLQLEVPMETVIHAAKAAHAAKKVVLLNPAPAPADGKLPKELLENVDLLVPNETEASLLTGLEVKDEKSAYKAARQLIAKGVSTVLITLGDKGAAGVDSSGKELFVPAYKVKAIDTTAAGDAFVGALACKLADGRGSLESIKYACAAGALATTKMGAAPSLPTREEIEEFLSACAAV